jgi:hypothetical protein
VAFLIDCNIEILVLSTSGIFVVEKNYIKYFYMVSVSTAAPFVEFYKIIYLNL